MQDWVYCRMLRSKSILVFAKDVLAIQEGHNFIKHDFLKNKMEKAGNRLIGRSFFS